jgi:hypothetical protein
MIRMGMPDSPGLVADDVARSWLTSVKPLSMDTGLRSRISSSGTTVWAVGALRSSEAASAARTIAMKQRRVRR